MRTDTGLAGSVRGASTTLRGASAETAEAAGTSTTAGETGVEAAFATRGRRLRLGAARATLAAGAAFARETDATLADLRRPCTAADSLFAALSTFGGFSP